MKPIKDLLALTLLIFFFFTIFLQLGCAKISLDEADGVFSTSIYKNRGWSFYSTREPTIWLVLTDVREIRVVRWSCVVFTHTITLYISIRWCIECVIARLGISSSA